MPTNEPQATPWWVLVISSLAVGVIAGLGAVVFRAMIGSFHNLLFLGQLSWNYDANVHTPASPWGTWVILVPVIGAIGVAFLVQTFAPEAKGHGVPEVMDAIYFHHGIIRPVVAAIKAVASALSIGSGGSVGREGPIIQIGAAFGSTMGQIIAMPVRQRVVLIAAGAGGGIAATFNTPIGGITFAMELMLPLVSPLSLLCVGLASVTATYIGQLFLGLMPSFNVPLLAHVEGPVVSVELFPWFVALGLVIGVASWAMTRSIYWFEDLFDRMPGNYYTRHMFGMLLVGLMLYGLMSYAAEWCGQPSHYYVEGVGYATIMDILRGEQTAVTFLLVLAAAKLLATCLTLGSGASGGVFSPCMFLGAALGAGFGSAVAQLFPELGVNPVYFAVAGMAGMVGGTTGAVVTATIMTFEMTRDYTVILPVILTVVLATAVRQWLSPSSIYTLKLLRRGHVVPQGLQAWRGGLRCADVMSSEFEVLSEYDANEKTVRSIVERRRVAILVGQGGKILGARDAESLSRLPAASQTTFLLVESTAYFVEVMRQLDAAEATLAVVTEPNPAPDSPGVVGIISAREIAQAAYDSARLML